MHVGVWLNQGCYHFSEQSARIDLTATSWLGPKSERVVARLEVSATPIDQEAIFQLRSSVSREFLELSMGYRDRP
jgi:hypothetical protein